MWHSSSASNSVSNSEEQKSSSREAIFIGVLAHRGIEDAYKQWSPTANFLTDKISGYKFYIVPLNLDSITTAIEDRNVDFIITNPVSYATLEATHGLARMTTLINLQGNKALSRFGAVIFTRADRNDITKLDDILDKTLMAVHETAFVGVD